MNKPYRVTKDISANFKKLKVLEKKGIIKIFQVKLETPTPKIKNIDLPNTVWNHTNWNESLLGSKQDSQRFEKIKSIFGGRHIGDAIHLDTHIREKRDYFLTEDTDILKHRKMLEKTFNGLRIRTPNELIAELGL